MLQPHNFWEACYHPPIQTEGQEQPARHLRRRAVRIGIASMHLKITRPDDWHVHLRDGDALKSVVPMTARQFARAIVMPNLVPPVTSTTQAKAYRDRILAVVPGDVEFTPLMTLYLTDQTGPAEIERARASGMVHGVKLYPAGATTNSESGVTHLAGLAPTLEAMAECGLPLLVHGEVTDADVDIFDREAAFLERVLAPLMERHPRLRIVLEHITTEQAVNFVRDADDTVAATITAHHLLYNRNALFHGGVRPHHYCLPILKRERHRQALLDIVASGHPRFFLGTDSAPHERAAKETACGCAGIFTAHAALELYATALEGCDALDRLEGFASHFGADFYRMPRNTARITLIKDPWTVPERYRFDCGALIPLGAGETLNWRLSDSQSDCTD